MERLTYISFGSNIAIENFKKRHEKIIPMVPKHKMKAIAGFSTEAVLKAIGNDLNVLVDVIVKGQIKGIVALANCSTLRNKTGEARSHYVAALRVIQTETR